MGDVRPGPVLFGVGLVTFVAPLTATVMASVDPNHVGVGSGVNDAFARTASLAAVAAIPVVSGLTTADDPASVAESLQTAMLIAAAIAACAAPVAFFGLRTGAEPARDASR